MNLGVCDLNFLVTGIEEKILEYSQPVCLEYSATDKIASVPRENQAY